MVRGRDDEPDDQPDNGSQPGTATPYGRLTVLAALGPGELVVGQPLVMQRRALLVESGFRPLALCLVLSDPGLALRDLGSLRALACLLAMLRDRLLAPLLEFSLLGATPRLGAGAWKQEYEQGNDDYGDDNDRDQHSC